MTPPGPNRRALRAPDDEIVAAGGIVMGNGDRAGQVAVVHRTRYGGEVALPKGKLEGGEAIEAAAIREVEEETGWRAAIVEFAGSTAYLVNGRPKTVFYFVMQAEREGSFTASDEVAEVRWLAPAAALQVLTHRDERDLLAAVISSAES